ncbi:VOC family protein [Paenibacillus donghaensis]|uniref:VOC family protein n=1 Tax=Paenibacillus donghaensis TaxID=414771 RepID=UPI00188454A9|nr:VOC family protein [Paenibacillus donghaensis]MBE9914189.1 VOC family protein [Paenibacillus donghaensis]
MQSGLNAFTRIDRVILPVPDVRLAAEWYVHEFEFKIARTGSKEIDLKLHECETLLTLTEPEGNQAFRPLPHLDAEGHVPCFNFYTHWEDLHGEWLDSRGIRITETMQTPYMNVCEMTDPYGNVIGICHEKSNSLFYTPSSVPIPPMFHRVLAVFLPVRDLESSIRWYSDVLGFKLHNHWGQGADLMIGASETVVTMICMDEMLQRQAIQAMNGRAYYSLQTSAIHEVYRKLSTMGVTDGPCREQNGVNMFHVMSPEGLTIRISEKELVQVG